MAMHLDIPEDTLERIVADGRKEAKRNREATGILEGYYDAWNDSITVLRRYSLNSQVGDGTSRGFIRDVLTKLFYLPRAAYIFLQVGTHTKKLKRMGRTPAEIIYHTHTSRNSPNSWTVEDLVSARDYAEFYKRGRIKFAALLYKVGEDKFDATDGYFGRLEVRPIKTG